MVQFRVFTLFIGNFVPLFPLSYKILKISALGETILFMNCSNKF